MARVLAIGDMHLGRVPRRLPTTWAGWQNAQPYTAWERAVQMAIQDDMDAVLLAGDVIDNSAAIYSAFGPLEKGIRMLKAAGIPVYAVAGNHDAEFLRHFERIDGLRVLGKDSCWECVEIDDLRVVGWSFTSSKHRASPLQTLPEGLFQCDRAAVGLLHCDLDGSPDSHHAPVSSAELDRAGAAGWLLGHIHRATPSLETQPRPIGYLGSLVGLDPTETGVHGAWKITTSGTGVRLEFAPIRAMVWFRVAVDATGAQDAVELKGRIEDAIEAAADAAGTAEARVSRIDLTGRLAPEVFNALRASAAQCVGPDTNGGWIDAVDTSVLRPAIRIHDIAKGNDVPAILGQMLLQIERGEGVAGVIGREAGPTGSEWWTQYTSSTAWKKVGRPTDLADDELRQIVLAAGYEILEDLLDQKPTVRASVAISGGAAE